MNKKATARDLKRKWKKKSNLQTNDYVVGKKVNEIYMLKTNQNTNEQIRKS